MAICLMIENPDLSKAQAEQVIAHVRSTGPVPLEGARLVLGGQANPGWRMISVWDLQDALERFLAGRFAAAYDEAGLSVDRAERTQFEVHALVAGDLTGVPQPA